LLQRSVAVEIDPAWMRITPQVWLKNVRGDSEGRDD
jgi:hypothetical protein